MEQANHSSQSMSYNTHRMSSSVIKLQNSVKQKQVPKINITQCSIFYATAAGAVNEFNANLLCLPLLLL